MELTWYSPEATPLNHLYCISSMLNKRTEINNDSVRQLEVQEQVGKCANIWTSPEQGTAQQMVLLQVVKHDLQPMNWWIKNSNCYSEKTK